MLLETHRIRSGELLKASQLSGIIVPLITPFIKQGPQTVVDVCSQNRQIRRLIDAGVQGIFLGSNAGQGREMTVDNWKSSIKSGIESVVGVDSNIPVVVGVLRENLDEAVELAHFAEEAGADALVLAPGFTKGNIYEVM